MDDLSLEQLQAALQSAQDKRSTARLSERNVVELVNKLQELGFLDSNLLHSIHGKEYITPQHLCSEVKTAVTQAGGRIAMADLPAQLGVDLSHCQREADNAVAASRGRLRLIQGELMAATYFDLVAAETAELLEDAGMLTLVELATRFKLGSELMHTVLTSHLDSTVKGRLESGILFTAAYITRIKAQVRGALRGSSLPVNLTTLIKTLGLPSTASTPQTVTSIVDELVQEGTIKGSLKARTFVPAIYARAQQQSAHSFYQQNGFIEFSMLDKLGIADGKGHVLASHPDAITLESVMVAPQLQGQLEAAVEEATASGSWTDAASHLPPAFSGTDVALLLQRAQESQRKSGQGSQAKLLAGSCVVSSALLEDLRQRALVLAREAAEAALKARRQPASQPSTSGTKSGDSKTGKPAKNTANDDSDDDWDTGRGGSKKKKAGKKKAQSKGKSATGTAQPSKPSTGNAATDSAALDTLSQESVARQVERWLPEAEGAGEDGSFPEAVAAEIRLAAVQEYERALAAVFSAGAEARRRRRDELRKAIEEAEQKLQLYAHGAELAQKDEATHSAIQRHLLRAAGQPVFDLILRYLEVDVQGAEGTSEASKSANDDVTQPLTASERSKLMKAVPADSAASVAAAEAALNGQELEAGLAALRHAAEEAGLQLRKLDKKAEKPLVQSYREVLKQQLQEQEQPADTLSLAVPLLVAQVHGRAMSIPGKALSGVIGLLKDQLQPEAYSALMEFHSLVVEYLRQGDEEMNPKLLEMLPGIKRMAGIQTDTEAEVDVE